MSENPKTQEFAIKNCVGSIQFEETEIYDLKFEFEKKDFENIADDLSLTCDMEELIESLSKATVSADLQYFALFVMRAGPRSLLGPRMCTNWPARWVRRYCEKGYQFIDPLIEAARQDDGIFYLKDVTGKSSIVDSYISDAKTHRIGGEAICFAFSKNDGTRMALQFHSDHEKVRPNRHLFDVQNDLEVIANLAADAFCYICQPEPFTENTLTVRELQFLFTLATQSNPEFARRHTDIFGGNLTLQSSIKKKLNVVSVFQAVSIAVAAGWFNDLPIKSEEVLRLNSGLIGWDFLNSP